MISMEDSDMGCSEVMFDQVMSLYQEKLDEILGDPLLSNISQNVTLEEVRSMTSLETGQAMTIQVCRADGDVYAVIVNQNATVADLKKSIKRHYELKKQREGDGRAISWKYLWKAYWLVFHNEKLKEDEKSLREYGIGNRDQVTFIKRLRE